jgi:serine/threonine protein kinase/tetratricopeptide (TPR) repeat protein
LKCPKCHTVNSPDSKFCKSCAAPLPAGGEQKSFTRTLETTADELTRGTVFAGRYEIIEELGAGGMGKVYRAFDKKLEEEIALKLIRPEIAAEKRTVERFRNEIKIARKITHKNVCRTHDLGEEGKALFITMEYVRGEDLKSVIRRMKVLAVGTAVSIARQVAEGLGEAHRLGVIHRDLKPSNVMIDKEGNAKIMDFGIARSLAGGGTTVEGAIIGTPEYMSPEQVDGKPADARADIYALGVILFEMVTGRPPFEGETAFSIANKHKSEPAPDPTALNPQIPADLGRLILRCLEKEKEKRYQTTAELLADLEVFEAELPTTECVPGRSPSRTKPKTSREITIKFNSRKLVVPVAALAVLAFAGFLIRGVLKKDGFMPPPRIENSIAVISLENQTGDKANDYLCRRMIPDAFIVNLENSGLFSFVPTWERMTDLLNSMGKKEAVFIGGNLGFEICRRLGIKTLVSGSLNRAGETYNVMLRVLDAESKNSLGSFKSEGGDVDSLLKSQIDALSLKICQTMGITLEKIGPGKFNIAGVVTSSPAAYEIYCKGLECINKFEYQEAGNYFKKAIQIDPSFASAYRKLATVYTHARDIKARSEAIAKAKGFSAQATEKEKLYIDAQIAGYRQDRAEQVRKYEEIVSKYPKEKEAHYWLGDIFRRPSSGALQNVERAIKELETAIALDPNYASAYNLLGIIHSGLGNFDITERLFRKYGSLSPGDANPFDSLGDFYYRYRGDLDQAIEYYQKALKINPDFVWSNYGLTYVLALKEDYARALIAINGFLGRAQPPGIRRSACFLKAFLLLWQGQYEAALREAITMEEAGKEVGDAWAEYWFEYIRGVASFERGAYEETQRHFKQLLDATIKNLDPASALLVNIDLNFSLGCDDLIHKRLESGKSRFAEIETILPKLQDGAVKEKCINLRDLLGGELAICEGKASPLELLKVVQKYSLNLNFPDLMQPDAVIDLHLPPPLVRDVVPRAYLSKGDLDGAIAAYERLVTFDPKSKDRRLIHPLNYYRLAKVHEQKGNIKKAKANYRKFLDLWKNADPGQPEVEDVKKRLAALK